MACRSSSVLIGPMYAWWLQRIPQSLVLPAVRVEVGSQRYDHSHRT